MYSLIFSDSHSATYWQQEVTCFILSLITPIIIKYLHLKLTKLRHKTLVMLHSPTETQPDMRGGARACSSLLAVLIRARALQCEGPMVSVEIIRARALTSAKPYCFCPDYSFFSSLTKTAFLPPWTCLKSHQSLHASQTRRKIWYFRVFINGHGKMAL